MKFSTLAVAALAVTALAGGAAVAQDAPPAPGPAATMQPIPNPPETGKDMAMGHRHHMHHARHHMHHAMKAASAAAAPAAAPAQ